MYQNQHILVELFRMGGGFAWELPAAIRAGLGREMTEARFAGPGGVYRPTAAQASELH